jgi:hypothetical protein
MNNPRRSETLGRTGKNLIPTLIYTSRGFILCSVFSPDCFTASQFAMTAAILIIKN